MNTAAVTNEHQLPFASEEWDALRMNLKDSVIAETSICSLATNLGLKWPIKGKDETPERYIHSTVEELAEWPEFFGKGNRLSLLYTILLETKQLDDPFAEMMERFTGLPIDDAEARTPLEEMGVPMDFPMELTHFSKKTKALCIEGGHETLNDLITFLMESKTAVIMNDEFRQFLSCLNSGDRSSLAQFLPIREGEKGVFLAEAIGNIARRMNAQNASALLSAFEITASNPEWSEDPGYPKEVILSLIADVRESLQKSFDWMPDQANQLRTAIDAGVTARVRFFVSLNNPDLEALSQAIAMAAMDIKPHFKGLFSRFLG